MKVIRFVIACGSAFLGFAACSSEPPLEPVSELRDHQLMPCSESAGATATAGGGSSGAAASSGGPAVAGAAGAPFMPGPPYVAPAHDGNLIHVKNGCSFPLYLHGEGGGALLTPDDLKLEAGATHDYKINDWPFAYVDAYLDGPQQNRIERAELTLFPAKLVSYRLGYADGIGLPMELRAIGSGADCPAVACYAPVAQIQGQCPDGLLVGKRCVSPGTYCADPANTTKPVCHALDAALAQCVQSVPGCADAAGATSADVYACRHALGDKPSLCAALNRGLNDATSTATAYSGASAHNGYAAWLHGICPGLVAFPYDDVQASQPVNDAFHACQDSTQLNITFCPAG